MSAVLEAVDNRAEPIMNPHDHIHPARKPSPRSPASPSVTRNGVVALDNLSLHLRRGEIVALLGPNGAGKSTAVKLMLGLTAPTSGSVRIFGADPRDPAARTRTGAMLQVGRAPHMLRVREHITMFRSYYPNPMPYADIVKAAGLEGIEDRMFGQLSGGQKQRMLFALALAGDPDLIFLDEPTVGLDIEARRGLWAQIRALAARGKTVLLTTHYLEEADALAHRIIVINKGRVICEGTPAEVKSFGAPATSRSTPPPDPPAPSASSAASPRSPSKPSALSPASPKPHIQRRLTSRSPPPAPKPPSAKCSPSTPTSTPSKSPAPPSKTPSSPSLKTRQLETERSAYALLTTH